MKKIAIVVIKMLTGVISRLAARIAATHSK